MTKRRELLAVAAAASLAGCSRGRVEKFISSEDSPLGGGGGDGDGGGGGSSDPTTTRNEPEDTDRTTTDRSTSEADAATTTEGTEPTGTTAETTTVQRRFDSAINAGETFYKTLLNGNLEAANAMAHPESPGGSGLPVKQGDLDEFANYTYENSIVLERNEGVVSVQITLTGEHGRTRSELIAVRKHDGKWMVWRRKGCIHVNC